MRKVMWIAPAAASMAWFVVAGCSEDTGNSGNNVGGSSAGQGGTAGAAGTTVTGGAAGVGGTAGSAGAAGTAGNGGSAGTAGNGGGAGTAGSSSGGSAGTAGAGGGGGLGGSGGAGGDPNDPARGDIVVSRILANQGTQIEIYKEGSVIAPGERNAQLVATRPVLVQALWSVPAAWEARPILARLHAKYTGGREKIFDTTLSVSGEPGEGDLTKSFSWIVPKEDVEADMMFQVRLREGEPGHDTIPPSTAPPEAPIGALEALGVPADPVELHVTIVPVVYTAGSCSTDTRTVLDAARLDEWTNYMYARAPVQVVRLQVRPESINLQEGGGWQDMLQELQQMRISDSANPNEYYYALLNHCDNPPDQYGGYSFIADDTKEGASDRVSSGTFSEARVEYTRVTYVHELGHAQGRRHAPCGPAAGPDPNYPYENAELGVWGFDHVNTVFLHPQDVKDYMSYCYEPSWASDWTYNLHHQKAVTLTSWDLAPQPKTELREVLYGILPEDGKPARWWTTLGGANLKYAAPGEFVEFKKRDGSRSRMPAVIKELGEGPGRYLVANVPGDLANVVGIERISGSKRSAIPLSLRRIIR